MATDNAINQKRHIFSDGEDTNKGCTKRVCLGSDPARFPADVENGAIEMGGTDTGVSMGWTYTEETGGHVEEWESIAETEMKSRIDSPDILGSSRNTALEGGKLGKPLRLHGGSRPSSDLLMESDASDKVYDLEPMIENTHVPKYDACFGVIMTIAMSSFEGISDMKQVPVNTKACGDMLKVSFQDSNKYAGLINSPVLAMLSKNRHIQLNAVLIASLHKQDRVSKKTKTHEVCSSRECPVRIIVYGLACERVAVGSLLSDAGLYLQHPSLRERDRSVKYVNPHYLLRPGADMPELEELSIKPDSEAQKSADSLDEVKKSRLIRIFDLANEVEGPLMVEPSHRLRFTLQDHQLKALAMMSEKERGMLKGSTFPSLWEVVSNSNATIYRHKITGVLETSPRPASGGILADEMGLGKTLCLLALICWSLDSLASNVVASNNESRATLIIAPKSTIHGWEEEVEKHIHHGQVRSMTYHGSARRRRSKELENSDVVLTTYETMRSEWTGKGALYLKKWHRVVLDEAHHIRTRSSQAFQAACAIKARYRWCLTGTPIQNSLDDYGALLSFVEIQPFTDKAAFDFWIAGPVKQNRPNSLRVLEDLVRSTCLRRTKSLIHSSFKLPQRSEKVEWIELSLEDRELYTFFKVKAAELAYKLSHKHLSAGRAKQQGDINILTMINILRLICDHGEHLLPSSAVEAWRSRKSGSIDWQMMDVFKASCDVCGVCLDEFNAPSGIDLEYQCQHSVCLKCATQTQMNVADDGPTCPKCMTEIVSGGDRTTSIVTELSIRPSAKVEKLIQNLRQEQCSESEGNQTLPKKSLVFSSWTKMLDLVQNHLELNGFIFQRIDGQSSLQKRRSAMCQFSEDPKCTVMLASIGSAGEGVDLTAANHVHLLEPHWNPMAEAQAVDRVHRIGQTREVFTTRYITRKSIETYVQWVQKQKMQLIEQSLNSASVSQSEIDEQRWKKLRSYIDDT